MPHHIALLGDSIFDNKAYTGPEPDVVGHLRTVLGPTCRATLLAVDGTTTQDVGKQFDRVPADATHLVLSLGGNDAILNADLLATPVKSTGEALVLFGQRVAAFERSYRNAVTQLLSLGKDTTVCTIYNANLGPEEGPRAWPALMMFNDVILRTAFEHRLRVIDLRFVCTDSADYANPIEPSGIGGRKIAGAIARAVGVTPGGEFSSVFGG